MEEGIPMIIELINAVKEFYREICRENIYREPSIFPRTRHKLPNVLSKEEVKRILSAPVNEKHRLLLKVNLRLRAEEKVKL